MNERYEHEGLPLDKTIIRDILTNKQPPPQELLSISDLEERITRYHLRNGGESPEIGNPYSASRYVLIELHNAGRVERIRSGNRVYFRSLPAELTAERLIEVIRQERERIESDITTLENRKAELDTLLSDPTLDGLLNRAR